MQSERNTIYKIFTYFKKYETQSAGSSHIFSVKRKKAKEMPAKVRNEE